MPDHFYVYPAYLARGGPRSLGRRIATPTAPAEVTVESIVAAATALGFRAEAEPGKQYPRRFYDYSGRVKITKKGGITKGTLLKRLAAELLRRTPASGHA
jgi:signal recognition particle subunit SEC65